MNLHGNPEKAKAAREVADDLIRVASALLLSAHEIKGGSLEGIIQVNALSEIQTAGDKAIHQAKTYLRDWREIKY